MWTVNLFALRCLLLASLGLTISTPAAPAALFTDAQLGGSLPSIGSADFSLSDPVGSFSDEAAGDSTSLVIIRAVALQPTGGLSPYSLMSGADLFLSNTAVPGPGPWPSNFASVQTSSSLESLVSIGSYTDPLGSPVEGILRVDLVWLYTVGAGTTGTVQSGFFGPNLNFGIPELDVSSRISANVYSGLSQYGGAAALDETALGSVGNVSVPEQVNLYLFGGNDRSGTGAFAGITLEIPFSTFTGDFVAFDVELDFSFLATWNQCCTYQQFMHLATYDPITVDLTTPGAYYIPADNNDYFGPAIFSATTVDEPNNLALVLAGLLACFFVFKGLSKEHPQFA